MSGSDVYAALVREYGKSNVKVGHTVCMRDYVAAIKAHKSTAPDVCLGTIDAQNAKESLSVGLMEDVAAHNFGVSRVVLVTYQQPLPSQADQAAFMEKAKKRFGRPDNDGTGNMAW